MAWTMVLMPTFSTVPVQVEARQFEGVDSPSFTDIQSWCGPHPEQPYSWVFERADAVWTEPYDGIEALLWNRHRGHWDPLVKGDWVVQGEDKVFTAVPLARFTKTFAPG